MGNEEARALGAQASLAAMAEFVRSFYQDYLGVHINMTTRSLAMEPKLPDEISSANFTIFAGEHPVSARYERMGEGDHVVLRGEADGFTEGDVSLDDEERKCVARSNSTSSRRHHDVDLRRARSHGDVSEGRDAAVGPGIEGMQGKNSHGERGTRRTRSDGRRPEPRIMSARPRPLALAFLSPGPRPRSLRR